MMGQLPCPAGWPGPSWAHRADRGPHEFPPLALLILTLPSALTAPTPGLSFGVTSSQGFSLPAVTHLRPGCDLALGLSPQLRVPSLRAEPRPSLPCGVPLSR